MIKLKKFLKSFPWGILLFSILFVLSGIAFIMKPDSFQYVKLTIGIVTCIFALFFVIGEVLASENRSFRFWSQLTLGVFAFLSGLFFVVSKESANAFLFAACGYFFVIDGSFKLQTSYLSKRFHSWLWWIMAILSVLTISGGVILDLLRPNYISNSVNLKTMVILTGLVFFVDGISNFFSIFFNRKVMKGQKKELEIELQDEGKLIAVVDRLDNIELLDIDNQNTMDLTQESPVEENVEIKNEDFGQDVSNNSQI